MNHTTIISTQDLADHLEDPRWLVVDCRFVLSRQDEKAEHYLRAHIPGAIYAHLDHDLAAPIVPGVTGRHPLPTSEEAARRFGEMGIGPATQVVVYDDQGGALAAVRLWWMLRWLGHSAVAVLDGGWQKWIEEDRPTRSGRETRPPQTFIAHLQDGFFVTSEQVERLRQDPAYRIIDVRVTERYRGEVEPIDPVAGHIPGAHNAPYTNNLSAEGVFKPAEVLRADYQALLDGIPTERAIFYCGSGVTSAHSLLAMKIAGLGQALLYPGSWSEWIAPRTRPIALGSETG
jgi:thiosulfate/3-mercaptopyruvate sulfurtransferase